MSELVTSLLKVKLEHRLGSLTLDVEFSLTKPWSVLFAPSGAGKTTILRAVAGLLRPDRGQIVAGTEAEVLTDTQSKIFVAPHQRRIRMVSQSTSLFPHLDVLRNVRYGLGHAGEDEAVLLRICRVEHLLGRRPEQLSGGERQRVALARALAPGRCRFLLLDEPFTGLELDLRDALLADVREWLKKRAIPVLQVTHDVAEVLGSDAEVLTLVDGRVAAQGAAGVVLQGQRERIIEQLGTFSVADKNRC